MIFNQMDYIIISLLGLLFLCSFVDWGSNTSMCYFGQACAYSGIYAAVKVYYRGVF